MWMFLEGIDEALQIQIMICHDFVDYVGSSVVMRGLMPHRAGSLSIYLVLVVVLFLFIFLHYIFYLIINIRVRNRVVRMQRKLGLNCGLDLIIKITDE